MKKKLDIFSKYLTLWVGLCMILGALIGYLFPGFAETLGGIEIANVSIPVAVVLLFMMYPVMLKIEFSKIAALRRNSKPLLLTLVVNWAIKPFTMAAISYIFMRYIYLPLIPPSLAEEYIAGMILLGLAPCTAMVLVWTYLADGNLNYALLQVAVNDLIILFIFAPLGKLLIGVSTNFPVLLPRYSGQWSFTWLSPLAEPT
ncbi:MAG: arsenite transporter [Thermotogota bacterium]|nr:arsenite transporter [Thermotogota bacterium]